MEDLTGQSGATNIDSGEWNAHYQEFKNFVEAFVTMDVAQVTQLRKATSQLAIQAQWTNCSGGTIVYTLSMNTSVASPFIYNRGQTYQFRPNANNTVGAVTVNVGSLGARSVVREDGSALQAADLSTTRDAIIRYNDSGSKFQLLNHTLAASAVDLPFNYITGLTMNKSGGEPAAEFRDIQTQIGRCRDTGNNINLVSSSIITKRWDATFAFGSGVGGLPAAVTRTNSSWFRFFIIGRNINGTTDFGFDTDGSAVNLLAAADVLQFAADAGSGWDHFRQIGWVRTDPSTGSALELEPFDNPEDEPNAFYWTAGFGTIDYETATFGTAGIGQAAITVKAPPETVVIQDWWGFNKADSGTARIFGMIKPTGQPNVEPSATAHTVTHPRPGPSAGVGNTAVNANDAAFMGSTRVRTDASQQISVRWDADASNARAFAHTRGFMMNR